MLPASALGTAVNSMAGQNIGAYEWDRVRKIGLYGVLYNLAIMFSIAVVVFLSARYGIQMLIREEEAVRFGAEYLQIIAFMYPFLGINFVLNGIVRASGAMFQVLVLNFVSFWILRFPLTYLLSGIFGEIGIAYGVGVSFMISSMISFFITATANGGKNSSSKPPPFDFEKAGLPVRTALRAGKTFIITAGVLPPCPLYREAVCHFYTTGGVKGRLRTIAGRPGHRGGGKMKHKKEEKTNRVSPEYFSGPGISGLFHLFIN